jgi:CBS domain-containing protein
MSYYVKDYMEKEFSTLDVGDSVVEAAKVLGDSNKGYIIVLEKGKPKGIVTEWDIISKVIAQEKDPKKIILKEIMSMPLYTVDPDEDLIKASELMAKKGVKRLPVVKGDVIYGVITSTIISQRCGEYVNKSVKDVLRWSFPIG